MTRALADQLGVPYLNFSRQIRSLELASGRNSVDIRLSTELDQAVRQKIRELGLDPKDTTGEELYSAILGRVQQDEKYLQEVLSNKYSGVSPTERISKLIASLKVNKECYALKNTSAKRLLKKQTPKHTMKALGYRSFDSMLKHEPAPTVIATALLLENESWKESLLSSYKNLKSKDFELRKLTVFAPSTKRWQDLASSVVVKKRHNVVILRELGSIVLMPLPKSAPSGAMLAMLLLVLNGINEIRAGSSYLKLNQVRPGFGESVAQVATNEAYIGVSLLDRVVPWQMIQRYYAKFSDRISSDIFEPHVQAEDLTWHSIEKILSEIHPTFDFWQDTPVLSFLNNGKPVSMNLLDAAVNYCNKLPFTLRVSKYFQTSLWHELALRYLSHENVEQTVLDDFKSSLVTEPELV